MMPPNEGSDARLGVGSKAEQGRNYDLRRLGSQRSYPLNEDELVYPRCSPASTNDSMASMVSPIGMLELGQWS